MSLFSQPFDSRRVRAILSTRPAPEAPETTQALEEFEERGATFGERLSDRIADFGGSWTFILSFIAFCGLWMGWNLTGHRFDNYPFILLNLVLSLVAALQAPVIMMSQRRQEAKDRSRAVLDFQLSRHAEDEVRALREEVRELAELNRELLTRMGE